MPAPHPGLHALHFDPYFYMREFLEILFDEPMIPALLQPDVNCYAYACNRLGRASHSVNFENFNPGYFSEGMNPFIQFDRGTREPRSDPVSGNAMMTVNLDRVLLGAMRDGLSLFPDPDVKVILSILLLLQGLIIIGIDKIPMVGGLIN